MSTAHPAQPAPAPLDPAAVAKARPFGRVDDEGKVWLKDGDTERVVGHYAASGTEDDALEFYIRRYIDLDTQVSLAETRAHHVSPEESRKSIASLRKELAEPAAVGDIAALRTRLDKLEEVVAVRAKEYAAQRAAAKEAALQERTQIVERAEEIANANPHTIHWQNTRAELNDLFENWKRAQRQGARIDRPTEEALWRRFATARSTFDRARRNHYKELDVRRSQVKATKEKLIAEAAALSSSTDWRETGDRYRELMDEWKRAGRAGRRDDDKLWERFMAARQPFYDARDAHFSQVDSQYAENLAAKLELVAEAEALLPITNVDEAREKLREIGERWDEIGFVARGDIARTEGRMREIEEKIRAAENDRWNRTDPEKQQRSSGMAAQLEALIAELDEEIAQARQAGDEKKLTELNEARAARVAWLEQVNKDL